MNERRLTIHPDGSVTGGLIKMPIGATAESVKESMQANNTLGQLNVFPSVPALTAQQRISELRKKISEYKSLLSIVTDATTKNFVNQLLNNIDSELSQIQMEIGKIPVQTGPITMQSAPYTPSSPTVSPTWVGGPLNPGLSDFSITCAGHTCVTYPLSQNESIPTLSETAIWDKGMAQESIEYKTK